MKKKIKRLIIIILCLLSAVIAVAGIILVVNVDLSNPSNLDNFIKSKAEKADIPGISVALVKNGNTVTYHNYGVTNTENNKPVTEDTLFQIASVSKTVTATTIMQLYEKGLIDLDENINKYLPFKVENPGFPGKAITVRMLLNHTSSIANNWPLYDSMYTIKSGGGDSPIELGDFMKGFLTEGGQWYDTKNFIPYAPGEKYNYSNPAYGLLGYLVEEITKSPFNHYCQENIFTPLDMTNSRWLLKDMDTSRLATPYDLQNNPLPNYSFPTYPDGALKTSTREYANFIMAILNDGTLNGNSIISKQKLDEMFVPQADDNKQALCWDYSIPENLYLFGLTKDKLAGHTGADPGIFTITLFDRETKNAMIVFTNKEIEFNIKTINVILLIRRLAFEAGF